MRSIPYRVLPIVIVLLSGCTSAEEPVPDCSMAMTTRDINECAAAQHEKAEARLNNVYQQLMARLSQPGTELENNTAMHEHLRKAQRLWVAFREADCEAQFALYASGTLRTAAYLGCMQARAEQRTTELENYFPH